MAADKKSLQRSTVPAAIKNAQLIYKQNADYLKNSLGIRDYDTALRFAENYEGEYGVGLGAVSDPDREKKRKILSYSWCKENLFETWWSYQIKKIGSWNKKRNKNKHIFGR